MVNFKMVDNKYLSELLMRCEFEELANKAMEKIEELEQEIIDIEDDNARLRQELEEMEQEIEDITEMALAAIDELRGFIGGMY